MRSCSPIPSRDISSLQAERVVRHDATLQFYRGFAGLSTVFTVTVFPERIMRRQSNALDAPSVK